MRPFGSDQVELGPDGVVFLICRISKEWTPRQSATRTSAEHPGTAVRWEGEVFEVVEEVPRRDGTIRYRLSPWEDRHTIRGLARYEEAAEAARREEQDDRRLAVRKRRASVLLAPLLGHLPGPVQRRMESEFGAPARAMTIASALPLFVLSVVGLLAFLATTLSAGNAVFSGWPLLSTPLALYFFVESAIRLGIAFSQGEPMGSAAGTLLYELGKRWAGWSTRFSRRYASAPTTAEKAGKEDR